MNATTTRVPVSSFPTGSDRSHIAAAVRKLEEAAAELEAIAGSALADELQASPRSPYNRARSDVDRATQVLRYLLADIDRAAKLGSL